MGNCVEDPVVPEIKSINVDCGTIGFAGAQIHHQHFSGIVKAAGCPPSYVVARIYGDTNCDSIIDNSEVLDSAPVKYFFNP